MAERRMFAKTIIDSDAFLDMPLSTQALYFHLSMRADDEGFVGNPKKIQRMIGASDDDMKILIMKRYILTFDSGIVVIKHWKIHNYIQADRFKETTYIEEKSTLTLDEKKAYTECTHFVSKLETQDSIGKISIELDKDSVNNCVTDTENFKFITKLSYEQFLLPNGEKRFIDEKRYGGNGMKAWDNSQGKCQVCGTDKNLCLHHNNGNSNELKDLLVVCRSCHRNIEEGNIKTNSCKSNIFNYWNTKDIIVHRKLTEDISYAVEKALKTYSEEEIKNCIDRYAIVLKDTTFFFKYVWSLKDFLNRKDGISSFTDEGSKWNSYQEFLENPKPITKPTETYVADYTKDFEGVF